MRTVSINMAMTIDGKIAPMTRGPVALGTPFDRKQMQVIRAQHDAVLNGATTFRAYPFPLHVRGEGLLLKRKKEGRKTQPISAIVSSRLDLPRGTPWERATHADRWIFCGKRAPKALRRAWEAQGVKVVRGGGLRPKPAEILEALEEAGVRDLLLEGGGELNASFLEADLVDQIYLTVVPKVLGGEGAPTWFEGRGFPHAKRFKLKSLKKVGEEVYLLYGR